MGCGKHGGLVFPSDFLPPMWQRWPRDDGKKDQQPISVKGCACLLPLPRLLLPSVVKGVSSERSARGELVVRAKSAGLCSKEEHPDDETKRVSADFAASSSAPA